MYNRLKLFQMMREYDTLTGKEKENKLNEILLFQLEEGLSAQNLKFSSELLTTYGGIGTIKIIKQTEFKRNLNINLTQEELDDLYDEEDED